MDKDDIEGALIFSLEMPVGWDPKTGAPTEKATKKCSSTSLSLSCKKKV